jgi:hypothetical protein
MMISKRSSLKLLGITLLLMLIPLMANWLNNEFHWKFGDFILMGAMIYGLGLISLILMNVAKNKILRCIVTGLFFLLFLLIWVELAVGIFDTPFGGS